MYFKIAFAFTGSSKNAKISSVGEFFAASGVTSQNTQYITCVKEY
jgi:hypothetical protein